MKKTLYRLLALFLFLPSAFTARAQISCCSISAAPAEFAALSANEEFRNSHQIPLPYTYQENLGKMITFRAMDGSEARAFEIKAASPTDKWVFVFHEWWGLNDYIKKESARLSRDLGHVNVLAFDLYDGKVAASREEAGKLSQGINSRRVVSMIEGAVQYAGPQAQIATIGWCFGGGWSMQAAPHADLQAAGCVIFYGQPESDPERLADLDCSVLGIFATQDKFISPKVVQQFEQNMKAAGKKLTVHNFTADHAFANPSNPSYNQKLAQEAYSVALTYLRDVLQLKK